MKENKTLKGIASMAYKKCIVCEKLLPQNLLLIQKNFIAPPKLDYITILGYSVCEECSIEGLVPLIVAVKAKKNEVTITGETFYVPKLWAEKLLGKDLGEFCFIDQETADNIKKNTPPENQHII